MGGLINILIIYTKTLFVKREINQNKITK